jgi:hypothetical protein
MVSLFGSHVPSVVAAMIGQAHQAERSDWNQKWQDLSDLLNGEHHDATHRWAIASHPKRSTEWNKASGQGYRYFRLVGMVAERLAATFNRPPEIYLHRGDFKPIPSDDPQAQQWKLDASDLQLPILLQTLERRLFVLKQVAVMPVVVHGRMRWRMYGPQNLSVIPDPDDAADLRFARAIEIQVQRHTGEGTVRPHSNVWTYDPETERWGYEFVDGAGDRAPHGFFADGVNQYGQHPLVLWRYRLPVEGDVFVPPDEELLHAQLGVNIALTDLHYGLKFQVHPQQIEFGKAVGGAEGVYGPDVVRQYNDKATEGIEFKTPDLNISEYRETIEWGLRMYAVSQGLPPDTFSPNSSTRNLGAKQHEALELHMRRESLRPSLVEYLQQTFALHKAIGNYWAENGVTRVRYDSDLQLGVRLKPIPQVTDRATGVQADQAEQAEGLTSRIEREMAASGCSRDEAAAIIEQRQLEDMNLLRREQPGGDLAPFSR